MSSNVRVPYLNIVLIAGRLVREPEMRTTPTKRAVVRFTIANNRRFRTRDGDFKEETVFVNVVAWDRQAEYANQQLHKGSPVLVEGRLRLDEWDDRVTGQRRSRLEVVAWRVSALDKPASDVEPFEMEELPPDEEPGPYPNSNQNYGRGLPGDSRTHSSHDSGSRFPEDDVPF